MQAKAPEGVTPRVLLRVPPKTTKVPTRATIGAMTAVKTGAMISTSGATIGMTCEVGMTWTTGTTSGMI